MFFTNFGKCYRLKGYKIPEGSRISRGLNVVNLLPLENSEKITAMIRVKDFKDEEKFLCMVTKKGIIKRTKLSAYDTRRSGGLIAVILDEDDELAWVRCTNGNDDLLVATKNGMSIRFNENDARPIGRTARGVKAIELAEGDEVVGMTVLEENSTLLTVTSTGYGRRSEFTDYRVQSRAGKGLINYKTERYGKVCSVVSVKEDEDIIMISKNGIIIRMAVSEISTFGRPSKGVRVMRTDGDDEVISVVTAEHLDPREEIEEGGEDVAEETAQQEQTQE